LILIGKFTLHKNEAAGEFMAKGCRDLRLSPANPAITQLHTVFCGGDKVLPQSARRRKMFCTSSVDKIVSNELDCRQVP
jgi:hypothetical protein